MKKITLIAALMASLFSSPIILADVVNINRADVTVLKESLYGIGAKKAKAIVNWREENGDFKTIEEIMEVSGIGEGLFKQIKNDISVVDETVAEEQEGTMSAIKPEMIESAATNQAATAKLAEPAPTNAIPFVEQQTTPEQKAQPLEQSGTVDVIEKSAVQDDKTSKATDGQLLKVNNS